MRDLATLFAALILVACSTHPVVRDRSQAAAPMTPPVEFLLGASAADFHAHRPPDPAGFRDVRIGHVGTPGGEPQYLLCGEFLAAQEQGKAEWVPFATIKTSGYEQWLGAEAASLCQRSSIIWDDAGDLSSSLKSRLESLR